MSVVRQLSQLTEPIMVEKTMRVQSSGVSGTILDDLSGTYKTFAEAVKEVVSNSYDADAKSVHLRFTGDYEDLEIRDDGAGMNPKQFVREYIRVGRSVDAKKSSPSGDRERIGGKGIGSLAPARYCRTLLVSTKTSMPLRDSVEVVAPDDGCVPLNRVFPYLDLGERYYHLFTELTYTVHDSDDMTGEPVSITPGEVLQLPPNASCVISYCFAADRVWLRAGIDFIRLRELGEHLNLDQVADLWDVGLAFADASEYATHETILTLKGLENFVASDLRAPGKPQARNIGSKSGIERFSWTLSRLCPVPVKHSLRVLEAKFPSEVSELFVRPEAFGVFISHPGAMNEPLSREVYIPHTPVRDRDAALCQLINFEDPDSGVVVRGYVIGSSTVIYPAELRGISVRVRGVELGAPTLFGAETLVTGPQHTALTNHITGELHLENVNVRRDILPGREGLYPESPVFRALRRVLVGTDDRLGGKFRELVTEILLRSEAHASAQGLVKKLELQRRAVLDAASAIANLAYEDEQMLERLMMPPEDDLELLFSPDVEIRPEGRLAVFTIAESEALRSNEIDIDYERKRLVLPKHASYLEKTVDIAGQRFEVVLKQAGKERISCEVDPEARYIFINWDHKVRGTMGDAGYIKHCLAALVCGLPQAALNRYVRLISVRSEREV